KEIERLRYRKGKIEVISEEEYLKEKKKKVLRERKRQVSKATERYIEAKLDEIDEDLSDLISEKGYIEELLLDMMPETITEEEIKRKIRRFKKGEYTTEEAIAELTELGLGEATINNILSLLGRYVEITKIIDWKEGIWRKEEELEKEIEEKTLEELLDLDIEKLCKYAYENIPLEV
ncbi:MAG: hypothetical protein GXO21_04715, partial [Aquificae bacterium]|nr:hypothetical protein [Aquificota bacterium]